MTVKNLDAFFNTLITAKAPEVFTQKFLESLEFTSSSDRLYIAVLKGLGFLDPTGVPTDRYFKFLDQSQSKLILADAIREAYGDLFAININAQTFTAVEAKNKFKTLLKGKVSDDVLRLMGNTFEALCKYADWQSPPVAEKAPRAGAARGNKVAVSLNSTPEFSESGSPENPTDRKVELHYNIQIYLPDTRDQAVYDALFTSLKKHLF